MMLAQSMCIAQNVCNTKVVASAPCDNVLVMICGTPITDSALSGPFLLPHVTDLDLSGFMKHSGASWGLLEHPWNFLVPPGHPQTSRGFLVLGRPGVS